MNSHRLPERIATDEIIIRRWRSTDADEMQNLITASLDHLRPWMAWAQFEPLTTEARLQLFDRWDRYWASGAGAVYAIVVDGEIVGGCSLHRRLGPGGLDLGYWLGRRASGRGIATRTAAALSDAAFSLDDAAFVQISHSSANQASGAVAQRLGFIGVPSELECHVTTWRRTCHDLHGQISTRSTEATSLGLIAPSVRRAGHASAEVDDALPQQCRVVAIEFVGE